jgi:hypothetical protein
MSLSSHGQIRLRFASGNNLAMHFSRQDASVVWKRTACTERICLFPIRSARLGNICVNLKPLQSVRPTQAVVGSRTTLRCSIRANLSNTIMTILASVNKTNMRTRPRVHHRLNLIDSSRGYIGQCRTGFLLNFPIGMTDQILEARYGLIF